MNSEYRGLLPVLKGLLGLLIVIGMVGCSGEDEGADDDLDYGISAELDENGKPVLGATDWVEEGGKDDAMRGRSGLPVSVDSSDLAVWEVKNAWSDRDTAAARKEGMAWSANSGLSWEEKFERWVDSMPKVAREAHGETFMLTTPYGVELPAPALECAEVAMFLRVAFASWYNLPFFMEGLDGRERLYFGHFGIRTAAGRFGSMPRFKTQYRDYSNLADDVIAGRAAWPTDTNLAGRKIPGSFDDAQPMLGPNKHTGAYFDKIFLNKRVGYFLLIHLTYMGSINLADPVNTFHITPEALRAGDTLLHRWQRTGIGHALVVMRAQKLGVHTEINGRRVEQLESEVASGSMPRRQPLWESPGASKRNFTNSSAGSPSTVDFNGGVKRWRTAVKIGGNWTNVVLEEFADAFVSSLAKERVGQRPAEYETILTELSDAQKIGALLEAVEARRAHLGNYPASCAARIAREAAFDELYELGEELGMSKLRIDSQYRELEDYVFAELEYGSSKTCCWNSSTAAMHDLVMDFNQGWIHDDQTGQCRAPVVFKARNDGADGFEVFREYAVAQGKGDQWVTWRADENCPQSGVVEDTEATHRWSDFCSAFDSTNPGLTPPSESEVRYTSDEVVSIPDNNPVGASSTIEVTEGGTIMGMKIDLEIRHTYRGDLVVELIRNDQYVVVFDGRRESNRADSDVLINGQSIDGYQGQDAAGTWQLFVRDTAAIDTGDIKSWSLTFELD
ncbi:MAG: proprotein convertase P-domain-containing protein [Bradymonadaceae bacterium]